MYQRTRHSRFHSRQQSAEFMVDLSPIMHGMQGMDWESMRQAGSHAINAIRDGGTGYLTQAGDAARYLAGQAPDAISGMGGAISGKLSPYAQQAGDALSSVGGVISGKLSPYAQQAGDAAQSLIQNNPVAVKIGAAVGAAGGGAGVGVMGKGVARRLRASKMARDAAAASQAAPEMAQVAQPGRLQQAMGYARRNPLMAAGALAGVGALGVGGAALANRQGADYAHRVHSIASFTSDPSNLALFNQYRR
jgi:hypothetical protein